MSGSTATLRFGCFLAGLGFVDFTTGFAGFAGAGFAGAGFLGVPFFPAAPFFALVSFLGFGLGKGLQELLSLARQPFDFPWASDVWSKSPKRSSRFTVGQSGIPQT